MVQKYYRTCHATNAIVLQQHYNYCSSIAIGKLSPINKPVLMFRKQNITVYTAAACGVLCDIASTADRTTRRNFVSSIHV